MMQAWLSLLGMVRASALGGTGQVGVGLRPVAFADQVTHDVGDVVPGAVDQARIAPGLEALTDGVEAGDGGPAAVLDDAAGVHDGQAQPGPGTAETGRPDDGADTAAGQV